jgi:hypothetical protein
MKEPFNDLEGKVPDPFLPESMVGILKSTAGWIRLASIIGFIGFLFSLIRLSGLLTNIGISSNPAASAGLREYRLLISFIGIIAFLPSLFLFISANKISTFCESSDYATLEAGFRMQKRFWKSMMIIVLAAIIIVPVTLMLLLSQI